MSLLGLVLFYVGAVLIINGLSMLNKIDPREATIMNIFTGLVSLSVCGYSIFVLNDPTSIKNAAFGLLFGFTYLWVAYNNSTKADGRGLGWFSLFVAITAIPVFCLEWSTANTLGAQWLALNWAAWAILWFSFFLLNVKKKKLLQNKIGALAIAQGIATAWVPGFLILVDKFPA